MRGGGFFSRNAARDGPTFSTAMSPRRVNLQTMEWSRLRVLMVTLLGFGQILLQSLQIDEVYNKVCRIAYTPRDIPPLKFPLTEIGTSSYALHGFKSENK